MDTIPPQLLGSFGVGEVTLGVHEAATYQGMQLGAIGLGTGGSRQQVGMAANAGGVLGLQQIVGMVFTALGSAHHAAHKVVLEDGAEDVGWL